MFPCQDDLLRELEDLEQEELDEQLLNVGPSIAPQLPDVPTDKPGKVSSHSSVKTFDLLTQTIYM